MKITNNLFISLCIFFAQIHIAQAQTTLTITTGSDLKDATLYQDNRSGQEAYANNNYGSYPRLSATAWTSSGSTTFWRTLMHFNVGAIPSGSTVTSATLYLYSDPTVTSTSAYNGNSQLSGSNAFFIEKVTQSWGETTVTWNSQPSSTATGRVWVGPSTSATENLQVDIAAMVQDWIDNPSANHGIMLLLENEVNYRSRNYGSSDHANSSIHPKLEITYNAPVSSDYNENYVKTTTIREPGIKTESDVESAQADDKNIQYAYFDGLGRSLQTVLMQASPLAEDIVVPVVYDEFGRENTKYLPFVSGNTDGSSVADPVGIISENYTASPHYAFYMNTANNNADHVANDASPFALTVFEPSPLNRVEEQGAPGTAWQPGTGKTVKLKYTTNLASEVFLWTIKDDQCILADGHYYAANELYVTVTKDEHWTSGNDHTVREYKDKLARVVLKRTYNNGAAHDTYYVYDDFGNLRVVIPPEAINQLGTAMVGISTDNIKTTDSPVTATTGTYYYCPGVTITLPDGGNYLPGFEVKPYPLNADIVDEYLFTYKYDGRKRMIEKKVPGAEPVYMVYDDRDRLVLTQDGEQRESNTWLFTKYDQLNRPILTGTTTISGDQGTVQNDVNTFYNTSGNEEMYETRSGDWNTSDHGYSDESYPKGIDTNNYLSASYYDDYDFENETTYDYPGSPPAPYNGSTKLDAPKGQVTGGKVKNLGDNSWLGNAVYYDKKYRPIYSITKNHLGGYDKSYSAYSFVGEVTNTQYIHTASGQATLTIDKTFDYDHMSRLLSVNYTIDGNTETLLTNEYNELGELVTKYLHGDEVAHSQAVDYAYNIRGWLTDINDPNNVSTADGSDYFGMKLKYNDAPSAALEGDAQYNGNISEIQWQNAQTKTLSAYGFTYDDLNRLEKANYGQGAVFASNVGAWDEDLSYDYNGNIETLLRKAAGTTVDNLDYDYTGNRLNKVDDLDPYSGKENHFVDGYTGTDYAYDANGNMKSDANKGIQSISYNHLNLPALISFDNGNTIAYIYDAAGIKLQKVVKESGKPDKITDYIGGIVYEDNARKFMSTEEGRIMLEDGTPEYQYHLKDHLGNVRLTYTTLNDADLTSDYIATMETSVRTLEEATFENIAETEYSLENNTAGGSRSARLNAIDATTQAMGPAMSLHVMPGDQIDMSTFAKYNQNADAGSDALTIMAAILSNSTTGGQLAELTQITNGINAVGLVAGSANWDADKTIPRAYLNYLFFDKHQQYKHGAFKQVSSASLGYFRELSLSFTPDEEGYLLIYVGNQTNEDVDVYFDDLKVTHKEGPIVRTDDYYPFGLTFNSTERSGYETNEFLYNGKELQTDLDLDWYDYGWRMYDPTIGRWNKIDNHAENYYSYSPYNFVLNDPINVIDPDGNDIYVLTWFSDDGEIGHAGIAIDNYKTVEKKDEDGNTIYDEDGNAVTEQVKDGTVTYYDLWPQNQVGQTQLQDDVAADYTEGRVMTFDALQNTDPTDSRDGNVSAEGRKADGIIQLSTTADQDATAKSAANGLVSGNGDYNACANNCSTFTQNVLNSVFPNVEASQQVRPSGALRLMYDDASVVAPNNLYNAALKVKGAKRIRGPEKADAKPYLEYFGKSNRED